MTDRKNLTHLHCWVNGRERDDLVKDNLLLADYLRETVGLTGTKIGCDGGECGCCTVLVDDIPKHACLTLAAVCQDKKVETIEAQSEGKRLSALQQGFHEKLGTQCGFCTPGMIMRAKELLEKNPNPTEEEIRWGISGNLCRCTGYVNIIKAIQYAANKLNEQQKEAA